MKLTLLEIVQAVLSEMDSDEVTSIGDTSESDQVALLARDVYLSFVSNKNWAHTKQLVQLPATFGSSKPTLLKLPDNIKKLEFVNYDSRTSIADERVNYQHLTYLYPDEFIERSNRLDVTQDSVEQIQLPGGGFISVTNNANPRHWTSFDDVYLVCDSYDSDLETNLQETKTQAFASLTPNFVLTDGFVPLLPDEAVAAYLEELKSRAYVSFKQSTNPKMEQEANRQRRWLSRNQQQSHQGIRYKNFGRRSKK